VNRQLLKLQRNIINDAPRDCAPYDHYAYNSFSWTAQDLSYRAKNDAERQLCLFLKGLAVAKAKALREQQEVAK
jgi:hypothetical protein